MNHGYYVPSHQISYHIPQQACLNRNADNIADQLKLLKSKKHVNQSLHSNKDPHINQHKFKSQKNITSTKLHSSRRQKSQDVEAIQQSINQAIKQLPKQSKVINGYMVKQQLNSNSYQSPKQQQIIDYQSFNKDKTVIKTEPDTQICSDRIICYRTPVLTSKQIQSKEQIKSICKQIYPLYKQTDETTNLNLDIRNENQNKNTKLKTDVPDKILDLLMLSTRELKIKLSEKRTKQTSIPKTAKAGLPVDFFNFKK
ncbi:unnamed protein product [Paramecium octaurelia]|uniref:Uncharacterized protein n=1 Tax=Paramecium octaurelia TaxID=43137 RepID=A0A8S1VZM2_PAROT|nr:unnamed protein product [Paramecium octaurelia]